MNNHLKKIRTLLHDSSDHIDKYGHHQNDMREGKACCIMGAPRMIDKESSYSHITRNVLASLGYDEVWNDQEGRTKEEVVDALADSSKIVDESILEQTFGLKWADIVDLIVEVDSWYSQDYAKIEKAKSPVVFEPGEGPDEWYLVSLATFLATVMTSGKVSNSASFKNYFDKRYSEL